MTKKIFALVVAVMMVMALSVSAFAADVLTDDYKGTAQNAQFTLPVPEDMVLENGTEVTIHVVGTADNAMVRFYLTDPADAGRVTDVFEVPVEGGAFDATATFTIDTTGAIQGTAAPTVLMVKGPDYATPPANLVLEVVELSVAGEEAAAPVADDAPAAAPAAAAEEVVFEYTSPTTVSFGWTTLFEHGSADAAALFEALQTEGAVFKLIGTDLVESDKGEGDAWFQIAVQDQVGWTEEGTKVYEGQDESYEFNADGYVLTAPATDLYAFLTGSGVDTANLGFIFNSGGDWAKAGTVLKVVVTVPAAAEAPAPAVDNTPVADAPAADAAPAPAPAATTTAPNTGLALAVIPAVMALAAVAVSKKH